MSNRLSSTGRHRSRPATGLDVVIERTNSILLDSRVVPTEPDATHELGVVATFEAVYHANTRASWLLRSP
jgi:hypothetical protein